MKVDQLLLDAMVQKHECSDDAWKQLLLDPNREENWEVAVKRREQLDWFCSLAASYPMMAKAYRSLRNGLKSSVSSPKLLLASFDNEIDLLSPTLSSVETLEVVNNLFQNLLWGDQEIIEFHDDLSVEFKCDDLIHIHYEYGKYFGWITSDMTWDLKQSEGPIMLTFCRGNKNSEALKEVIEQSNSVASIILLPNKK